MTSGFQHHSLAEGRWFDFSLTEQLGNIGSEVSRAIRARGDKKRFDAAVSRALELFHLTISDPRWSKRLKELTRVRELFCDAVCGNNEYGTLLEDLDSYFSHFACATRSPYVQAETLLKDLYQFIDDTFITYMISLDAPKIWRPRLEQYEFKLRKDLQEDGCSDLKKEGYIADRQHIFSNDQFKVQTNTWCLRNILAPHNFEDIQAKHVIKIIYDDWNSFYRIKLEDLLGIKIQSDIWGDLGYIRHSITHRRSMGIDKLRHAKLIKDFSPGQKVIFNSKIMEKIREELDKWYTDFSMQYFSSRIT